MHRSRLKLDHILLSNLTVKTHPELKSKVKTKSITGSQFIGFKNNHSLEGLKAPDIGNEALKGEPNALETIKLFFSIFGTIISSVILINGAQSGVVIAGGITPKLQSILSESDFELNLLNKGRRYNYIKTVPIWLTENNNNGLIGASKAIGNPHYISKIIKNK